MDGSVTKIIKPSFLFISMLQISYKISKSEQTIFSDIKRHYCGNHDRRTVIFTAVNLKASTLLRIKPKNSKGLMYCAITTLLINTPGQKNKQTKMERTIAQCNDV